MKRIFSIMLVLSIFASCQKDEPITEQEIQQDTARLGERVEPGEDLREHTKIILGRQKENPYSVQNMQIAFDYYNQTVPSSSFQGKIVKPTHLYIKIIPTTEEQLKLLDDLDNSEDSNAITLQDYPMDYEVLQEGDYYVEPTSETDLYYPTYTAIPVGYRLPQGLNYEVLEELYKPTDDEDAIEITSWTLTGDKEDLEAELGRNVSREELPAVLEEFQNTNTTERRRYTPYGWVKIDNSETHRVDPLMKAQISIGRWFWWHYTYTRNDGLFISPASFRGRVKIRAKWRGYTATIRKSWNELLGLWVSDHLMVIKRRTNGRTRVIHQNNSHLWYKGTTHNGLRKYIDYANTHGVNYSTSYANVWTGKDGKGMMGGTPMFYKYPELNLMSSIAGVGESEFWDVVVNKYAAIVVGILPAHLRPDYLFRGLKNHGENTARIEQLIFHESGHYSHGYQAGAQFWAYGYANEIANIINRGNPYVDGTQPTIRAGREIALSEGWATFMEFKVMDHYYHKASVQTNLFQGWSNDIDPPVTLANFNENFHVYDTPMTIGRRDNRSWFLHGLFTDILDNHVDFSSRHRAGNGPFINYINDHLSISNGTDINPLFKHLTRYVYSAQDLRKRLLTNHPTLHTEINQLFDSYGY